MLLVVCRQPHAPAPLLPPLLTAFAMTDLRISAERLHHASPKPPHDWRVETVATGKRMSQAGCGAPASGWLPREPERARAKQALAARLEAAQLSARQKRKRALPGRNQRPAQSTNSTCMHKPTDAVVEQVLLFLCPALAAVVAEVFEAPPLRPQLPIEE